MSQKSTLFMVTTREEENTLMEELEKKGYLWKSGQKASDIPALLRKTPDVELISAYCIEPAYKTISFVPLEVYTKKEREDILRHAYRVEDVLDNANLIP